MANDELPGMYSVQENAAFYRCLRQAIVEDSSSSAQNRFLVARGKGQCQARRKVVVTIHLCLPVVTHAHHQSDVWIDFHLVLKEAVRLVAAKRDSRLPLNHLEQDGRGKAVIGHLNLVTAVIAARTLFGKAQPAYTFVARELVTETVKEGKGIETFRLQIDAAEQVGVVLGSGHICKEETGRRKSIHNCGLIAAQARPALEETALCKMQRGAQTRFE